VKIILPDGVSADRQTVDIDLTVESTSAENTNE
jgi:hypothetical protein